MTAKHVAQQVCLGDWIIRANARIVDPNGSYFQEITGSKDDKWCFHPTEVDVAVTPFPIPEIIDYEVIPEGKFVNEGNRNHFNIGPGDEVAISGVFTRIPGAVKNLPIVRIGNIALMSEPGQNFPALPCWKALMVADCRNAM